MRLGPVLLLAIACSSPSSTSNQSPAPTPDPTPQPEPTPRPDPPTTMKPWIPVAESPSHPEAVGLWRVPVAARRRESPGVVQVPGCERFLYDGETVVLFLATMKEWMYRVPDDHWRLETEWQGDVLHYRPPFGRMTPLARFTGGHFESTTDTPPYVYERVASEADCDDRDRVLLAPRPHHDYSIKPTDPSPAPKR